MSGVILNQREATRLQSIGEVFAKQLIDFFDSVKGTSGPFIEDFDLYLPDKLITIRKSHGSVEVTLKEGRKTK